MIHFMQVTPIQCISHSGRTISHTTQVSYVTGIPVKNLDTGRTTNRQHTDGTEIIYQEIISYKQNKYTDKTKLLTENLASMSSDLYNSRKQKNENIWYELENALPNYYNDQYLQEIARSIGIYLSKKYNRPIIIGIHKKDGNNHLHALIPGRELSPSGEWKNKRKKLYKDKHGNLIYDKVYKDTDGHDIRQPIVPKGEQPVYDDNGVCINQVKIKGRRQWDGDTHVGDSFSKTLLPQLHDEIDNIHNEYFAEHGIDDRVVRISPDVKKIMQKLNLKQLHYGKRASAKWKQQVIQNNQRYHIIADYIATNLEEVKKHGSKADLINQAEQSYAKKLDQLSAQHSQLQSELNEMDNNNPIPNYVENILKPEESYIKHETEKARRFASDKADICKQLMHTTATAWHTNNTTIEALLAESESPRNKAKLALWTANNAAVSRLYNAIKRYSDTPLMQKAKDKAQHIWRGLTGWQRYKAIKTIKGSKAAVIYKDYLMLSGAEPAETKVPSLTISNIENIKQQLPATLQAWKKEMSADNHIPPTDISLLEQLASAEFALTGEPVSVPVPPKYKETNRQVLKTYTETISSIEATEQEAKRLAEQEHTQKEATKSVATLDALFGPSVAAFLQSTVESTGYNDATYQRLSKMRAIEKHKIMEAIADAQIKANATDYSREQIIRYLNTHSTVLKNEAHKYDISTTAYDNIASIAKDYWQRGPKYKAAQEQKRKSNQELADRESAPTIPR